MGWLKSKSFKSHNIDTNGFQPCINSVDCLKRPYLPPMTHNRKTSDSALRLPRCSLQLHLDFEATSISYPLTKSSLALTFISSSMNSATPRQRLNAPIRTVQYANAWPRCHQVSLQTSTSPPHSVSGLQLVFSSSPNSDSLDIVIIKISLGPGNISNNINITCRIIGKNLN